VYAIASLLDPAPAQVVQNLWERLDAHCGLAGVKAAPLPHFSWLAADAYQTEPVEQVLAEISGRMQPFTIQAHGLGVFTGPKPVVYVVLVKDDRMMALHRILAEQVRPFAIVPSDYYDPPSWIPHVTLALREVDAERLGCAVADIVTEKISFKILVDHLAVLYFTDGKAGVKSRFEFGNKL
jgi:2'-5' RNA ligase